MKYIS